MPAQPDISVVIPAFNEAQNVRPMYDALTRVLKPSGLSYELIWIDDGSRDSTWKEVENLHMSDKRVIGVRFRRNFKKAAALMAGFREAKGSLVLTMDADLQDEPAEIPRLIQAMRERNLDLVVGWKRKRKDPWHKLVSSWSFNLLVRKFTGITLHDSDCNFRLMKRDVVDHLDLYGGLFRYIPSIAHANGFRVGEIPVVHNPRRFGKSKYGLKRLVTGPFDLLTIKFLLDYKSTPLHFFGFIGLGSAGLGALISAYLVVQKIIDGTLLANRPLLLLAILLIIIGVQFMSFGLLAELIQSEGRRRSTPYVVQTVLR
jgi:glycosyltransferase involved in cell wall biosynthesis